MPSSASVAARREVAIIGGGPAGLTAGYCLLKQGIRATVIEKRPIVGGLSCTEQYRGNSYDMGGHRFFTKSPEVQRFWYEILGDAMLRCRRLSRIYYRHKFFHYPIQIWNAFTGLGLVDSLLIALSYVRWQLFPYRREDTFEQWVTNRFGKRLFETFFKTYTEKVWGLSCSELKAEWAAQRIKDLSLKTVILNRLWKPRQVIKTLIDQFEYPRRGPGMMWNAVRERLEQGGATVCLDSDVSRIVHQDGRVVELELDRCAERRQIAVTDCISSMPITEFVQRLDPPAPAAVLTAARALRYRDFITVGVIVNQPDLFPDNWIYVHDAAVQVGRIQNFKNWSADMVADPRQTSLGLEYFCNEGDALWNLPDHELIALAGRELQQIGLANAADIEDGCVFRIPKAYPVYDSGYREHLALVRAYISQFDNFQTIGRNGLHRYNNQDHAMLTGMLAVENLLFGTGHDLWTVNSDQEYHEEVRAAGEAAAPARTPGRPRDLFSPAADSAATPGRTARPVSPEEAVSVTP